MKYRNETGGHVVGYLVYFKHISDEPTSQSTVYIKHVRSESVHYQGGNINA